MIKKITLMFIAALFMSASAQKLNWKFETKKAIYSTPVSDDDNIYIGSDDGNLYCLNLKNGNKIWSYSCGQAIKSTPAIYKGSVIVSTSDGRVVSLDKIKGTKKWEFKSKREKRLDIWDYYTASPIVNNNTIYWGCGEGVFYALDANSGKVKWERSAGSIIHGDAVYDNERVYFGDFKGNFYAYSHSGELKWKFKALGSQYFPNAEFQRGALLHEGVLYIGCRDYNIYAIDAKTGRVYWNMREEKGWIIATPTIVDDKIYFGTSDAHKVYCYNRFSGNKVWESYVPMRTYGNAVAHGNNIYLGCFDGRVYGFNKDSGKQMFEFATESSKKNYSTVYNKKHFKKGFQLYGEDMTVGENTILNLGSIIGSPIIVNGNIIFGSVDGNVYNVRIK